MWTSETGLWTIFAAVLTVSQCLRAVAVTGTVWLCPVDAVLIGPARSVLIYGKTKVIIAAGMVRNNAVNIMSLASRN